MTKTSKYHYLINPKYKNLETNLIEIKKIFKKSNKSIHKARNELKIVDINGIKCVIKAFKVPHLINKIAYSYFRDGKAKKSYLNAMELNELGVNTPEPIGIIEFYKYNLLHESYFISIYEPYDFTIREVIHHKAEEYSTLLTKFAQFTYDIHQKGVWHEDYSLGNILITKQNSEYKFSLVDINRMQFKKISAKEGLKNFNKLWTKNESDLITLAKEYSSLSKYNEVDAIEVIREEENKIKSAKNKKNSIKRIFGIK